MGDFVTCRTYGSATLKVKDPHSTEFDNIVLSRFVKFVSKLWGEIGKVGEIGEIVQSGSGLVGGLGRDFFP